MKLSTNLLVLALLFAAVFATAMATSTYYDSNDNYMTFDHFISTFNPSYAANGCRFSFESRRLIFEATMDEIRSHNKRYELGQESWFMRPNQFSDLTNEEFRTKHLRTSKSTPTTFADKKLQNSSRTVNTFTRLSSQLLAPNFTPVDWSVVLPIGIYQSGAKGCGSCWAHGATNTLFGRLQLKFGKSEFPSRQQLVSCSSNTDRCGGDGGCEGSTASLAYDYITQYGLTTESEYSYTSGTTGETGECLSQKYKPYYNITSHYSLQPNNRTQFIEHLRQGPVAVSVSASGWKSYGGGIYTNCAQYDINHIVTAAGVGYDEKLKSHYYLILNSWQNWGEDAYIRLYMTPPDQNEPCGVDPVPYDGSGCQTDPSPRDYACGCSGVLFDSTIPLGLSQLRP